MNGPFVVDNSVVMAWCFEDESQAYSDLILGLLASTKALVPSIWPLEIANVLLVAQRKNRLTGADASRFLALVRALPISVVQETTERELGSVLALAGETGLSSYDASYLDLAMRQGLPLATLDKSMRKAAQQCHVPLVGP